MPFLSTPSARRATCTPTPSRSLCANFYPRPPRGGRLDRIHKGLNNMAFLSTPSARRATGRDLSGRQQLGYFYPRPPRGGRPLQRSPYGQGLHFYPRPPRGGRREGSRVNDPCGVFLSTPSARRATARVAKIQHKGVISIHALREEGDSSTNRSGAGARDFYPRPPRGGRPNPLNHSIIGW